MAVVATYHNPFTATRDFEKHWVPAGTWIADHAPKTKLPFICLVNGKAVLRKDWCKPVVDSDVIAFVVLPQGGGSSPLRVVAMIAVVVLAAYAAPLAVGFAGLAEGTAAAAVVGGLASAAVGMIGSALVNALIPAQTASGLGSFKSSTEASPTYSISAQGNAARIGEAIPVQYGRVLCYPDFAAAPYVEYSGNEQYLYELFCIGLGEYDISQIRIEDTNINSFDEVATALQNLGDASAEAAGSDVGGFLSGSMDSSKYADMMMKYLKELPEAELETLVSVLPMSFGMSSMGAIRRVRAANDMQKALKTLQENGDASKLRGRALENYKKFIQVSKEGTPVQDAFIDAQDFTTYFQSMEVDPAKAAAEFGVENYDEAMATGGKILMPFENWVGEFSENGHAEALLDTTTLNETIPSIKDAALHRERVKRILENNGKLLDVLRETEAAGEQAAAAREAIERITDVYRKHLEAVGMTPETALTQAKVAAAFHVMPIVRHVESLAKEQGREVTRDEIARAVADRLNRYDLRIDRTSGMQVRTPRNLLPRLDSMLATLRAGNMPSARAVYGKTLTQAVMAAGGLLPTDDLRQRVKEGRLPKRLLRKKGLGADVLAADSRLSGYMRSLDTQSMQADDALVEALEAEYSRGEMTYDAGNLNGDLLGQAVMLGQLADDLGRAGIDLNVVTDDAEVRRLLQEFNGDRYGEQGEDSGAVSEAETVDSYEQRGFTETDEPTAEERAEANRQYDEVEKKYRNTPLWMKAPNEKLRRESEAFGREVDKVFANGRAPSSNIRMLSQTPLVMQMVAGDSTSVRAAAKGGIWVSPHTFDSALSVMGHPGMTADVLKQLPEALANPIAIFDSDSQQNRQAGDLVFMVGVRDANGATVVIPVALDVKGNRVNINVVKSAYGKENNGVPNDRWFVNQVKRNARYVNGQLFGRWSRQNGLLRGAGVQFPFTRTTNSNGHSVYNESDLAKLKGENTTLYQEKQAKQTRGAFSIGPNRTFRIELMAKANFSTFSHESAHFQLEMLADMVSEPDASDYIKQEWQTICDYLGGDIRTLEGDARTEAHERFARSFEAYLMEGKAPSAELKTAFRRFRDWMVHIYKVLRNLDVTLSDDIRRVFDRMLASDAQIEQAALESGMRDALVTAQHLGLSEDETRELKRMYAKELADADDRLRKRMMRSEVRRAQKQYKEELKKAQKQAEREYEESTLVYVGRLLTNQADRTLALNEAELVKAYGKDYLTKLPKFDGKNIYAKEGESFLNELAEANNFDSSEDLLRALEKLPPKNQWIAQRAQEIVDTFFGDTVNAAEISDAVDEAMNNDPKGERLKGELVLLRKAAKAVEVGRKGQRAEDRKASQQARREAEDIRRDVAAQYDAMRSVSRQVVADKLVKDVKPHLYLNAAHKAMRGAIAALNKAKPDYAEAARLKQQEVFNFHLYREARAVRRLLENGRKKMQDIASRSPKDVSKKREMSYVYKAQFIARSLLGRDTEQVLDRIQTETERGRSDPFEYDVGTLRELPVQDALQAISDANEFWESSLRESKILAMGKLVDMEVAGGELKAELDAFGATGRVHNRRDFKKDLFQKGLGNFITSMIRMESWCDMVGGRKVGDRTGFWSRYIFNPIKEAAQSARAEQTAYKKELADILEGFNFTHQTVEVKALDGFVFGDDTGYAKMEIAHAFLHCGNRSNFERLIVGRGWGGYILDSAGNRIGIDDSKWKAAVKELTDKGIWTKEDMDRVQRIWDLMARLTPKLQQAYKAVNGRYFDEIRAEPFEMFGKSYKGGYAPAVYDPHMSKVGQKQEVKQEDILNASGNFLAKLSDGFGVTRVQGAPGPLLLDLSKLGSHFDQQVLFANMAPTAADVGKLLRSEAVQDALMAYDPTFFQDVIVPWYSRAVTQNVYDGMPKRDAEEHWLSRVRSRAGIAAMFMNAVNTVEGFFDLTAAYSRVKAGHLHHAFGQMLTNRKATLAQIFEMSPYMRERLASESNQAMAKLDQALHPNRLKKVDNWINDHAYFLQEMVDGFTAPVVFLGAYNQAVEGGLEHAEAVAQAESVVRSVFGTMMPEDLANREAGGIWKRLFTQFTGYFVQRINLIASERTKRKRDIEGWAKQRAAVALLYGSTVFLPAWIGAALRKFAAGSDDENWSFGQWLMDVFGFGTASYVVGLGGVTVAGQAASVGVEMLQGNRMAAGRMFSSPATQLVGNIVNPKKWIDKDGNFQMGNALKNLASWANICPIVPVVPNRPVASAKYVLDVAGGKVKPTGVYDFARGTVTGRASKDSR